MKNFFAGEYFVLSRNNKLKRKSCFSNSYFVDKLGEKGTKIKKARIEIQPVLNPISYEKPPPKRISYFPYCKKIKIIFLAVDDKPKD